MRGYNDLDDYETNFKRELVFIDTCDTFDEDYIIPKIFGQFEKDYRNNPSFKSLKHRYNLSDYITRKLIRICQKRRGIPLGIA